MFWDGTHWTTEGAASAPARPRHRRRMRDILATVPILLLVPALIFPLLSVGAGSLTATLTTAGNAVPGTNLSVQGSGFTARQWIDLRWDGSPTGTTVRVTSYNGFTSQISIPADSAVGTHQISASSTSKRLADAGSAGLSATAVIAVVSVEIGSATTTPTPTPTPTPTTSSASILSVAATSITQTSAAVTWTVSQAATGQVEYGQTAAYGSFSKPELSYFWSTHVQSLSGLAAGTTYHYRVKSTTASGSYLVSGDFAFTTTGLAASPTQTLATTPTPAVTPAPATTPAATPTSAATPASTPAATSTPTGSTTTLTITSVTASSITTTGSTISWSAGKPATGQVQFGATSAYGKASALEGSFLYSSHVQTLSGLVPGTLYHYRVTSTDQAGAVAVSSDQVFTTLGIIGSSTPILTPTPSPTPTPPPIPAATPTPPPTGSGTFAAVFTGDATGSSDVTSSLRTFLEANNGKHVALAPNGVYKVTQLSFTASNLTVDFQGARIQGSLVGAHGILRIQTSSNVTLNDPTVYGTGYTWDSNNQNEHGIQIDGGSNITLNHPTIRDTRGDGINVTYQASKNSPPVGVVINSPDIERASRNGIAPVAGQVTIRGGHISQTGLHGIDFEVNDDVGANSTVGIVDGLDIRRTGDLPAVGLTAYAVAAGGYSNATKPSIVVQNLTGDILHLTIRYTASVTVRNNVSDASTSADFPGSSSITFSGNVRITRQ